jgi:mono/diheme cytochrome c family protein
MSFLHLPVVAGVIVLFLACHFLRARTFAWVMADLVGIYVLIRFGFVVPIPASVIALYMFITLLALTAYVTSSTRRREEFLEPLDAVANEPGRRAVLALALLVIPAGAAARAYAAQHVKLEAPGFARTVHPAPPDSIDVRGQHFDLGQARNPYRGLETSDPAAFRAHVASGKKTFYRNCVFCHGDDLAGDGMFAHALNPIPTNFTDKGTIPMLQEGYLFWRISKGGPGLPAEGGPWDSAMPAWEKFLTPDEIWDVVLFLYDQTNYRPRAEGEEHK